MASPQAVRLIQINARTERRSHPDTEALAEEKVLLKRQRLHTGGCRMRDVNGCAHIVEHN
jgi:hypothetical protein